MKNPFKEEDKGFECIEHEDGTKTCRRYVNKGKNAFATGTDVELTPDSQTCKVRIVGRINDEDREAVDIEVRRMEKQLCKKGF